MHVILHKGNTNEQTTQSLVCRNDNWFETIDRTLLMSGRQLQSIGPILAQQQKNSGIVGADK